MPIIALIASYLLLLAKGRSILGWKDRPFHMDRSLPPSVNHLGWKRHLNDHLGTYLVPVQKSGKMRFRGIQKLNQWCHRLRAIDRCQQSNEHLLIIVVFVRTSLVTGEKI